MTQQIVGKIHFGRGYEYVNESIMCSVHREEVIALRSRVKELEYELTQLRKELSCQEDSSSLESNSDLMLQKS